MFQSCVGVAKIPKNGNILARISDNVLDDDAWGVYQLSIENGVVKKQRTLIKGVMPSILLLVWTSNNCLCGVLMTPSASIPKRIMNWSLQ